MGPCRQSEGQTRGARPRRGALLGEARCRHNDPEKRLHCGRMKSRSTTASCGTTALSKRALEEVLLAVLRAHSSRTPRDHARPQRAFHGWQPPAPFHHETNSSSSVPLCTGISDKLYAHEWLERNSGPTSEQERERVRRPHAVGLLQAFCRWPNALPD